MACFWKNERNAVEVCLREVGNYVYIGGVSPDYKLVEVAQDLSGYVETDFSGPTYADHTLYSKRKRIYQLRYDATSTVWRDDGAGVFTEVAGALPGGWSVFAYAAYEVVYTAGKLRAVNWDGDSSVSFYESDDGEVWSLLPGSLAAIPYATIGRPNHYTVVGGRIIVNRVDVATSEPPFHYSDDGGTTWTAGTGADSTLNSGKNRFLHSGSNIIAVANSKACVSSNGAAWTEYASVNISTGVGGGWPVMAANGTGRVVAIVTEVGLAYSSNHGASWTTVAGVAAGIPDGEVYALYWGVAQFVAFVRRSSGAYQIYTSPTGATWTAGIVIPAIKLPPTQVID